MTAYLVGQIKVRDETLWQTYVKGVAESLAGISANVLFRGEKQADLAGSNQRDRVVVIAFDSHSELERWFHSPAYQALIPLRDKAADVLITSYT